MTTDSPFKGLVVGVITIVALLAMIRTVIGARPTRARPGGGRSAFRAQRISTLRRYAAPSTEPAVWLRAILVGLAVSSVASDWDPQHVSRYWLTGAVVGLVCGALDRWRAGDVIGALAAASGVYAVVRDQVGTPPPTECVASEGVPTLVVFLVVLVVFGAGFLAGRLYNGWSLRARSNSLGLQWFGAVEVARFVSGPGGAAIVPSAGALGIWLLVGVTAAALGGLVGFAPGVSLLLLGVGAGGAQLALATYFPPACNGATYALPLVTLAAGLAYLVAAGAGGRISRRP